MFTEKQLAVCTRTTDSLAAKWFAPLTTACEKYGINTPGRLASFLANVAIESRYLSTCVENLNYSAEGLRNTWSKRFTCELAEKCAKKPELIANHVYSGRGGNNNPGDGWKYRGRGLLQVTFHDNYAALGKALNLNLVEHPELLEVPENAALSAAYFFTFHKCNELADKGKFQAICGVINRGRADASAGEIMHFDGRLALYNGAIKALVS